MTYVLLTYRASYDRNVACHCHPEWEHGPSNLRIDTFTNTSVLAEFIANQICYNEEHEHAFLIAKSFDDFANQDGNTFEAYSGAAGIQLLFEDPNTLFESGLRAEVNERVNARQHARKEQEAREKAQREAREKAAERRQDEAELRRLQKKLGLGDAS